MSDGAVSEDRTRTYSAYSDYADQSDSGIDLPRRKFPVGPIPDKSLMGGNNNYGSTVTSNGPQLGDGLDLSHEKIVEFTEDGDDQQAAKYDKQSWLPRSAKQCKALVTLSSSAQNRNNGSTMHTNSCGHTTGHECAACMGEHSLSNEGVPLVIPSTPTATAKAAALANGTVNKSQKTTRRRVDARSQSKNNTKWQRLINLKDLYDEGFITLEEYKQRKLQLVDELTGTSVTTARADAKLRVLPPPIPVIPHPYPDFTELPGHQATQHQFDLQTGKWSEYPVSVQLDDQPFAKGGLRYAYYMRLEDEPDVKYVAKISIDPHEDREIYFQDVEMQMYCKQWAAMYNQYGPPKPVEFIQVRLITVKMSSGEEKLFVVEEFIEGSYKKHNNNAGYVDQDDRNTPQAFSHFTYESSDHMVLVCDIQGVGDVYTDPQMHTLDGWGFGRGNLGVKGFERFLQTHRCNAICHYLRLPSVNKKPLDVGTLPAQRMMDQPLEPYHPQLPPHALAQRSLRNRAINQTYCTSCCSIL